LLLDYLLLHHPNWPEMTELLSEMRRRKYHHLKVSK
jgi:L-rhamnose mutarotase